MGLQNNKLNKTESGFTIVELLIVIVVIGILAAITIVAFNGIQNRGKTAAGQSLANAVAKKAEAYNTIKSQYPTQAQLVAVTTDPVEAKLDNPSAVIGTAATASNADGKTVGYIACTASGASAPTGANITYWNSSLATAAATTVTVGSC